MEQSKYDKQNVPSCGIKITSCTNFGTLSHLLCKIGREVMRHPSKVIYADASSASCSIKHRVFLLCINSNNTYTLRLFIVRYSSGQRGQTVNLLLYSFGGSNPPLTTIYGYVVKWHTRWIQVPLLRRGGSSPLIPTIKIYGGVR